MAAEQTPESDLGGDRPRRDVSGRSQMPATEVPARVVFAAALRLGLTSFGGPIAHLGFFERDYVRRRRWLTEQQFAELVAVSSFLPGPTSSQVGMAVGYQVGGWRAALASWLGFTLPSAVLMTALAVAATNFNLAGSSVVLGLKLVAVAVVADAVLAMGRKLTATAATLAVAVLVGGTLIAAPGLPWLQVALIAAAGMLGATAFHSRSSESACTLPLRAPAKRVGAMLLGALAALGLVALLTQQLGSLGQLFTAMFRAGALVFGGGHVVLPLLEVSLVPELVSPDEFLSGYALAQAMPGPLFTFGTYLGQVAAGLPGAATATVAIFLPGVLLLFGLLPFWSTIRAAPRVRAGLVGVNAAVVGVLAAAWWNPVVLDSVTGWQTAGVAAALFALLRLRLPIPLVLLVAVTLAVALRTADHPVQLTRVSGGHDTVLGVLPGEHDDGAPSDDPSLGSPVARAGPSSPAFNSPNDLCAGFLKLRLQRFTHPLGDHPIFDLPAASAAHGDVVAELGHLGRIVGCQASQGLGRPHPAVVGRDHDQAWLNLEGPHNFNSRRDNPVLRAVGQRVLELGALGFQQSDAGNRPGVDSHDRGLGVVDVPARPMQRPCQKAGHIAGAGAHGSLDRHILNHAAVAVDVVAHPAWREHHGHAGGRQYALDHPWDPAAAVLGPAIGSYHLAVLCDVPGNPIP